MAKTLAHGAVAAIFVSSAAAQSAAGCVVTGTGFANSVSEEVAVDVGVRAAPPWRHANDHANDASIRGVSRIPTPVTRPEGFQRIF